MWKGKVEFMRRLRTPLLAVCCILLLTAGAVLADSRPNTVTSGVLYSRIGYDLSAEKRVIVRSADETVLGPEAAFRVISIKDGSMAHQGEMHHWGDEWNSHWWIADFTDLRAPGKYRMIIDHDGRVAFSTDTFSVGEHLLWEQTWEKVAIAQLKDRIQLRNQNEGEYAEGGGWQDCGSPLREVNSHATMLVGLTDMLEHAGKYIPDGKQESIREQIIIGTDYLGFCQDKAEELGREDGAVIHEWPRHLNVVTGDVAKSALSFARAARMLKESHPEKLREYTRRARRSFDWLHEIGPILHPGGTNYGGDTLANDGFEPIAYGAPEDFQRPDEWKTRDLVMMSWAAVELVKLGETEYKDEAIQYAEKVMNRQISESEARGGFYGHFRAYASAPYSEKAWEHHHMGYDVGSTFPHYLIPLLEMQRMWPEHPDADAWKHTLKQFAYGYFWPATESNPFYLLPMGYFEGEGLLTFSGLWHGINGAYGSAAALALELEQFTGDDRFHQVATGNLQWIAGVNAGVKQENRYKPMSMIYGIGSEYIGSWTRIPGTVCNGFDADRQFVFTEPKAETDEPSHFTDEGWITHSGGWLSATSRLRAMRKD